MCQLVHCSPCITKKLVGGQKRNCCMWTFILGVKLVQSPTRGLSPLNVLSVPYLLPKCCVNYPCVGGVWHVKFPCYHVIAREEGGGGQNFYLALFTLGMSIINGNFFLLFF